MVFVEYLSLIYSSMKKIFLLGIFASLFFAGCAQQTATTNLDEFAQCLTNKWAIMFGQVTCQHCQKQKAMFGESFAKITYVECTKEFERCGKELKWSVPAWKFKDGTLLEGLQELSVLAEKTQCSLPQ